MDLIVKFTIVGQGVRFMRDLPTSLATYIMYVLDLALLKLIISFWGFVFTCGCSH